MKKTSDEEDVELIQSIAKGNEEALRKLIHKYGGNVMRYCEHILKDFHHSEEAVQHVFTQTWRKASQWQPRAKVKTWLYTIAYRYCLNVIRQQKSMHDIEDMGIEDETPLPSSQLQGAQNKEIIDAAMNSLPSRQKEALLLKYAEDFSQKEIASILDVSEKAVESLLSRGKKEMSKKLNRYKEVM